MENKQEIICTLLLNGPVSNEIWMALAWCLGIMLVAYVLAMKGYRKRV